MSACLDLDCLVGKPGMEDRCAGRREGANAQINCPGKAKKFPQKSQGGEEKNGPSMLLLSKLAEFGGGRW